MYDGDGITVLLYTFRYILYTSTYVDVRVQRKAIQNGHNINKQYFI